MEKKIKLGFIDLCNKENSSYLKNPSLVALYLLTILEKEFGDLLDLSIIDIRGIKEEKFIENIPEKDVFLYSVSSPDYSEYKGLVERIRKSYPLAKHIAGGPHINIFPNECSNTFDTLVIGEGEESIKEIIKDIMNSKLKNIYPQKEKVNLSSYPIPLRKFYPKHLIAQSKILPGEYSNLLGTTVFFSKGCPFNCHFCSNTVKGKVQFRTPEQIIEEIEYLKKEYGVEALAIKDDNSIPVNEEIAAKYLEAIAKGNIKWRGQTRANGISPNSVKLAKKSGCVEIAVGIESVSQECLNAINKNINISEAEKYLKMLKSEKIGVRLLLILGLPGEPEDIAQKTIEFVKRVNPTTVLLSILTPMPGSEIYRNPKRFGIILDKEISGFRSVFGRFDKNEKPRIIFEYEKITPFGKGKSKEDILNDYETVQDFLRENNYNEY